MAQKRQGTRKQTSTQRTASQAPQKDEETKVAPEVTEGTENPAESTPEAQNDENKGADAVESEDNGGNEKSDPEVSSPVSGSHRKVQPPEGRILKADEPVTFEGDVVGNMVVVKEDVYREFTPWRSKRPTYILVYAKGTVVPAGTLQKQDTKVSGVSDDELDSAASNNDNDKSE